MNPTSSDTTSPRRRWRPTASGRLLRGVLLATAMLGAACSTTSDVEPSGQGGSEEAAVAPDATNRPLVERPTDETNPVNRADNNAAGGPQPDPGVSADPVVPFDPGVSADPVVPFDPGVAADPGVSAVDDERPVTDSVVPPLPTGHYLLWSDPATWPNGRVPLPGATVTIPASMKVKVDQDVQVDGLNIAGDLLFSPDHSVRIASTANVVVTGRLIMMPGGTDRDHHLEFVGVEESAFRGGGMGVVESDVGLWVVGSGQLVLQGSAKRAWTRATGSIESGSTSVALDDTSGWEVGDKIVIAPTARPDFGPRPEPRTYAGFHEARITAIDGDRVTFSPGTSDVHPVVNGKWTAEVMNLSRNVVISGQDYDHKAHVFVRAERPQFIRHAELRHLGPGRVEDNGYAASGQVLGRYGLHFHHAGNGVRGSIVEGVSLHGFGNKGFVPHESHGITFRDVLAYDGGDSAFWWDAGDDSHDILWDSVIAAKTRGDSSVFFLGSGHNVEVRDSVAVGSIAMTNAGGFEWENGTDGSWEFTNNVVHNVHGNGIRIWQNTNDDHVLDGFAVYHVTQNGVTVGAYTNNYHFRDFEIFATGYTAFVVMATPRPGSTANAEPPSVVLERGVIDGANVSDDNSIGIHHSAVPGRFPIQIRNVTIKGRAAQLDPAIEMHPGAGDKKVDLIDVTIEPGPTEPYYLGNNTAAPDGDGESWFRIQNGNGAFRLQPRDQSPDPGASLVDQWNAWRTDIAPFRSPVGTGLGLVGEYYDDLDFNERVYTGLDPYIEITEEDEPVYHLLDNDKTAVRWSGQVEAQQSGPYTFRVEADRSRLWVDGQQIIDSWSGENSTGSIALQAGRRYDIRLEVGDEHRPGDFQTFTAHLYWKQPDFPIEQWVPQSQLYPPPHYDGLPFTSNDPVISGFPQLDG